jgi:hypothetical protein
MHDAFGLRTHRGAPGGEAGEGYVGVAAVESFLIFGKDISRKGAKTQSKTQTEKISHAKTQRRKGRRKI